MENNNTKDKVLEVTQEEKEMLIRAFHQFIKNMASGDTDLVRKTFRLFHSANEAYDDEQRVAALQQHDALGDEELAQLAGFIAASFSSNTTSSLQNSPDEYFLSPKEIVTYTKEVGKNGSRYQIEIDTSADSRVTEEDMFSSDYTRVQTGFDRKSGKNVVVFIASN